MDRFTSQRIEVEPSALEPITLLVGTTFPDLPPSLRLRLKNRVESLPLVYIHAVLARAPETKEIITPLFSETCDAIELAEELYRAEYNGVLTVLAPSLPQPDVVLEELAQICPDATVRMVQRAPH